uniref:Uncharacterized protein n=1 Tax=Oryza glaberrima TaxID=4538 RepID=I1QNN7_ORYGL
MAARGSEEWEVDGGAGEWVGDRRPVKSWGWRRRVAVARIWPGTRGRRGGGGGLLVEEKRQRRWGRRTDGEEVAAGGEGKEERRVYGVAV